MRRLLPTALLVLAACSADPVPLPDAALVDVVTQACTPGAQVGCVCVGGATGAQICAADGRSLGACACPDAGGAMDVGAQEDRSLTTDERPLVAADVQIVDSGEDRPTAPDVAPDVQIADAGADVVAPNDGNTVADVGACPTGFADCNGIPSDGCEVNTAMGDIANCGACRRACPAPPVGGVAACGGGACGVALACPSDRRDCNMMSADGCETTVFTDVANCGACGSHCPTTGGTASCTGGACGITCNTGLGDCDDNRANGCEVSTRSSVANCGACGNACRDRPNGTARCAAGACGLVCAAGRGNCDGNLTNGCETNLNEDVNNCSACGMVCRFCGAGVCVP